MAARTRLGELASIHGRFRWTAAALVAALVTMLVAIPLTKQAIDARGRDDAPRSAPVDGIIATVGASTGLLDGSALRGSALITFELPDAAAVAFRLVGDDGVETTAGSDDVGPDLAMANGPDGSPAGFDTASVPDGNYTIYATFTLVEPLTGERSTDHRMASFSIDNSS